MTGNSFSSITEEEEEEEEEIRYLWSVKTNLLVSHVFSIKIAGFFGLMLCLGDPKHAWSVGVLTV